MTPGRALDPSWTEALVRSLPQAIITVDPDGRILYANPSAEQITGWPASEAIGAMLNEVLPVAAGKQELMPQLSASATLPPIGVKNRRGQEMLLSITTARLDRGGADPAEMILVIRDITAEDAAQHLRSHFLANISHEFRTPLSALKASVELLLEGIDTFTRAETIELARTVHFSVTSLQTLVDNLLESMSIQAGRFRIRRRLTDVRQLIGEAEALMKPLLERRNQRLHIDVPAELPQLWVDPMRLTQVLVNLLSNASKYGPVDQPIDLTLNLSGTDMLKISVADRGSGIPADERDSVFRRFVRLDGQDSPQYGIGLGLAVVKTVVESHGGTVGLEERPGGGSIFWFSIPLQDASG